jgi:hypothetical protein
MAKGKIYLDDEISSSQLSGHYQFRDFTFSSEASPNQAILSSVLSHGNAQFQYVSRKKKKAVAGPVDIMGKIEKITIYGFPFHKKVTNVSVNYSKPASFTQSPKSFVIKLPLVLIDESWDIVINWL